MKKLFPFKLTFIIIFYTLQISGQNTEIQIDSLYNTIKNDELKLRIFFNEMPKGGDLHHHYSGSIYAEKYLEKAMQLNAWIDTTNLNIEFELNTKSNNSNWIRIREAEKKWGQYQLQQNILKFWSVKDFTPTENKPSFDDFFDTFDRFGSSKDQIGQGEGLLWIKENAKNQKVSYIETMLEKIPCGNGNSISKTWNDSLIIFGKNRDSISLFRIFNTLKDSILNLENKQCIQAYLKEIQAQHKRLNLDDSQFTMRYLTYVLRVLSPLQVFTQMILSFEATHLDTLLLGVNIVAPEHNPVALRDYHLHMRMFQFCSKIWPTVPLTLHAGELTGGMVTPEDLNFHIQEAVKIAGAKRIGHGTALVYEKQPIDLLKTMKENNTVIEINFNSNAFILGTNKTNHPLPIYHKANIPIVICTDDAGVLRTDHTGEFVNIALNYPHLKYSDFKNFILNSIIYSFIKGTQVKETLKRNLENELKHFELNFLKKYTEVFAK